jgi:hypothetical protein
MEDLTNKITDLIIKSDEPLKTRDMLKTLKDDNSSLVRKDINSILYKRRDLFKYEKSKDETVKAPLWSMIS